MIHEVEDLEPELEISLLAEIEVLQRGEVPVEDPRALGHVAAGVPIGSDRLQREGADVEPLARTRVIELRADPGSIGTVVTGAGLGTVRAGHDIQGEPGGEGKNRIHLPAADDFAGDTLVEVLAALSDRQIVNHR